MTNCGFTVVPHTVVMWRCNRTVVRQLFDRMSRRSSVSVFEHFTGNAALNCFTAAAEKPRLFSLLLLSSRASSRIQQVPQQLLHLKSALYDQLNAEQMAAVQTEEDCVRVVAGPGSGKTLVLTHRIAHLIENRGVDPSQLLCLTFTNKAKNELQQRLRKLLGDGSSEITIGTFHSVCVRMLRESVGKEDVGVDKDFVIYDSQDSARVIKEAMEALSVNSEESYKESNDKKQKKPAARAILDSAKSIAQIKDYELKYFLAKENQSDKLPAMPPDLKSALPVFRRYQSVLRSSNAVDFDDLIYLIVHLLYRRKDLCQKYQNRWRYVLADEFQDTDWAQYVLVRLLCATNQKLFVVGDVDQAIYGWRGADYKNMDDLERHFQGLTTFELRKNYRSSRNILKLASEVINRTSRVASSLRPLKLQPVKSRGAPVTVVSCLNSDQEAMYVLKKISTLVARKQASFGSFGVLYRTRAQGEALEKWCLAKQIPYTISGSVAFLSYKEVKDLRAYLQLVWNPEDRVALDRVINTPPRGLGPKTLKSVELWASDLSISFYQALQKISTEEISHKDLGITLKARNSILEFCKLQEDLVRLSENDYVSGLIQHVIDRTQIIEYYKRSDGNGGKCEAHLQLFLKAAILMDSEHGCGRSALCCFLEAVALSVSLDQEVSPCLLKSAVEPSGKFPCATVPLPPPPSGNFQHFWMRWWLAALPGVTPRFGVRKWTMPVTDQKLNVVKLSTLHAAKGLEFDYVFITGVDDGTLPLSNSDTEEERRLFYVGVTRAREELVITTRMQRLVPGIGFRQGQPSQFLDLPSNLYMEETIAGSSVDPSCAEPVCHD